MKRAELIQKRVKQSIKQFREQRRKEQLFSDPMKGNVLPEMLEPGFDAGTNSFLSLSTVELADQDIPVQQFDKIGRNSTTSLETYNGPNLTNQTNSVTLKRK